LRIQDDFSGPSTGRLTPSHHPMYQEQGIRTVLIKDGVSDTGEDDVGPKKTAVKKIRRYEEDKMPKLFALSLTMILLVMAVVPMS
jgi:hypothetical protein